MKNSLNLPDFIIGGAPRSGTTWLYHFLERQKQIFMAQPLRPEPKFFLVDEIYNKGIEYYSTTWFSSAPLGALKGEKSANYFESPVAAGRIARHLPKAKLIFLLREPAARAYSNYLWSKFNGMESETFEKALLLEKEREKNPPVPQRFSRPFAYFSRGLYADLLEPYLENFSREQILCLRYEDIQEKPDFLVSRLSHFLNVHLDLKPADSHKIINTIPDGSEPISDSMRKKLLSLYAEPNKKLSNLLGNDFQTWGGS